MIQLTEGYVIDLDKTIEYFTTYMKKITNKPGNIVFHADQTRAFAQSMQDPTTLCVI